MVTHHVEQYAVMRAYKPPMGNIPRKRPETTKLGHCGGLREVIPLVEKLLNILDANKTRKKRQRLPRCVFWKDGIISKTPEVLDILRIK